VSIVAIDHHIQNCAYGFPGDEESFVSP